ncbi:MAG: UvrD-helicase domain-containing protein [Alphaproteobacteria bacterium]|nr:UvrD-helicase domain-containing protein [Alphaproteobacteria bacterium]
MKDLTLSEQANESQRQASNPFISAWVSASAGSGKTKVLTDRVLRLLLVGNAPETILCLTFTKAAAAEMANRLSKTLREWMSLKDEELFEKLQKLTGDKAKEITDKIEFARSLFARVLDTKGGMKIMTIHSFCQSILKRFPLEAGVSPSFEVVEENEAAQMLNMAIRQTIKNPALSSQMNILSLYLNEEKLLEVLKDIRKNQTELQHLLDEHMGLQSLQIKIYESLDVKFGQTEDDLIKTVYQGDDFKSFRMHYLTKDDKKIRDNIMGDAEKFRIGKEILAVLDKIKALKVAEATSALLSVSFEILRNFDMLKQNANVLDYTDLILKTRALLEEKDMASWVLYKLDGGIDHILLDEAQDTSPDQWAIVRAISEEFFSGEGRKTDKIRTLFAVGDKKQSIYRFQGADAEEFERMRQFFAKRIPDSQNEFKDIPLNISFRSTQAVLDMVNYLLRNKTACRGILNPKEDGTHFAYRTGQAGLVEVWPLEEHNKKEKEDAWEISDIENLKASSAARLSARIAERIAKMIFGKEKLVSKNRPIRPSDIMILVRSRDRQEIVSELLRALKKEKIPVADIDRLILNKHIAIMDLISLTSFLLLPDDDLSLAEILKSPLFDISEKELLDLAYNRGENSLWSQVALKRKDIYEVLKNILSKVDAMPPFELYSYILDVLHMREKFLKRMGNETNEMLDEFLNLALSYEQNHSISLEGFLKFLKDDDIEIKRDLDNSEINAVRIMTIHGSKGLQSNIVFLPDAFSKIERKPSFIWNKNLPIWIPYADLRTQKCERILNKIADAETDEYNRLLYVALTRAQDRLYICGFETGRKPPQNNWYNMIAESLPKFDVTEGATLLSTQTEAMEKEKKEVKKLLADFEEPEWFKNNAPTEPVPSRPLSPSRLTQTEPAADSPVTPEQEKAMIRGTFIHKLLQFLPNIEPAARRSFIKKLTPKDIQPPFELLNLLQKPELKKLFEADSLPEVPIVGTTSDGKAISGQIDRLVVCDDEVLIIDYKTNRFPPKTEKDIPLAYIEQMNAYKDLLKNIFDGKKIKCFLLWTATLTLMEIK